MIVFPKTAACLGVSRRRFVRGLGLSAVGAAMAPPLGARERAASTMAESGIVSETIEVSADALERVEALFAEHPVVDFHTHLGIWQTMGLRVLDPAIGALSEEKLGSNIQEYLDAGVNCLYLDTISDIVRTRIGRPGNKDRDFRNDEAWEDYLRQYAMIQSLLAEQPLTLATNPADIDAINARGELAVILSTEGAHMVERNPARIDTLAEHGLRRLQPIHYVASTLGDSQTDPERYGGLSDLGREVLQRASELGMLLDMAHASEAAVEQTIAMIDKPLAVSHTMVKYNSSTYGDYRKSRKRWISAAHARRIADTGGVIGTFPIRAPFGVDTLDAFVEALRVMVDAVGIDHVAWATDLGEPVRPAFLKDYRQFPRVCARLLDSGFSDNDLVKFMGGNALRVQAAA